MAESRSVSPNTFSGFRPARLLADECRVQSWFDSLSDRDRQRLYTVPEIRAAISIPATRLRIVLYRLGWQRRRANSFGVALYQGPFHALRHHEIEDINQIIEGFRQ